MPRTPVYGCFRTAIFVSLPRCVGGRLARDLVYIRPRLGGFVNGILRVFSDGEQEVVGHGEKGELSFCLKRLAGAARHRCLAFMVGFALSRIPYPHGPPAPTRLPEREAPARGSLDRGMASDVVSSIPGIQILTVDVGKN